MRQFHAIAFLLAAFAAAGYAQVPITVVNGAGFQTGAPVAPGSYAQVWGDYQGFPTENANLGQLPLPTSLGSVEVRVDGMAAPLYAVTPIVCAFNVPSPVAKGRHQIQVLHAGQVVGQGNIDVVDAFPGIFYSPINGIDVGGIRRATDSAYALSGTPAHRGGYIVIALTGQGPNVNQPVADGQAPAGPESTTQVTPRVFIAGVETEAPSYSGLMPVYPGLWQINVRIPDKPFIKGMVPLFVTYGDLASNTVAFWVEE